MQFTLVNPPKIFARSASGRMVQIAGRAGDVGRLTRFVVPNEHEIQRLRPVITYLEKLKPSEPFNYGTSSSYRKYPEPPPLEGKPIDFNKIDDLPLFAKR